MRRYETETEPWPVRLFRRTALSVVFESSKHRRPLITTVSSVKTVMLDLARDWRGIARLARSVVAFGVPVRVRSKLSETVASHIAAERCDKPQLEPVFVENNE